MSLRNQPVFHYAVTTQELLRSHRRLPREKHCAKAVRSGACSHYALTAHTQCFPACGSHGR
jgi:hypothetical protein